MSYERLFNNEPEHTQHSTARSAGELLEESEVRDYIKFLVQRFCYRWSLEGVDFDKDDIFQDVCFSLLKSKAAFRGESKLHTWLYRIVHNTCVDIIRKRSIGMRREEPTNNSEDPLENIIDERKPDETSIALKIAIKQIRESLPGLEKQIVDVLEEEGPLSSRELAKYVNREKSAINALMTKKIKKAFKGLIEFRGKAKRKGQSL